MGAVHQPPEHRVASTTIRCAVSEATSTSAFEPRGHGRGCEMQGIKTRSSHRRIGVERWHREAGVVGGTRRCEESRTGCSSGRPVERMLHSTRSVASWCWSSRRVKPVCQNFEPRLRKCSQPKLVLHDLAAEVARLQQMLDTLTAERSVAVRVLRSMTPAGSRRPAVDALLVMPSDLQDLERWLLDRHADLRDALEFADCGSIAKLTALLAQGAPKLPAMSEPGDDDMLLRSAPGEGRFAPY